ncbi:mechanosensitive ion channel family protein [Candidatus Saccharibacteria bacterium]|nr:mechanosensitive ion channel family protein [Candidatus Saccharibacteria bacterium]
MERFSEWLSGVDWLHMLLIIVIGAVIYKTIGFVIRWLVHHVGKVQRKESRSERRKRLKTLSNLFTTVAKVIVVLTIIFTILSDLQVNLVPLFASAGVAGVALGFGAQNIIRDALAGFFIILENQFRVGDYIDVSGIGLPGDSSNGTVERVSIRTTTLRDRNGNVHFIPNGAIVQAINKTMGFSKVHFTFAVGTGTDTDSLIKLIDEIGRKLAKEKKWEAKIVDPPHFSEIGQIGKEGFNVTISGTTEPADQWDVSSEFRRRLVAGMKEHGIETVAAID